MEDFYTHAAASRVRDVIITTWMDDVHTSLNKTNTHVENIRNVFGEKGDYFNVMSFMGLKLGIHGSMKGFCGQKYTCFF
jgi:hypothetical protein